jgi:threonine/homoserine/homoserine lactone efflux protein
MTLSGLLIFAGIYFIAVASPGPGLALVVARAMARGLDSLPWFIAGFVLGDLILFTLAACGLAFVAQTFEGAFTAVKYSGAAYLVLLAWKTWQAPILLGMADAVPAREHGLRALLSSLMLTLGNPKPIIFFVSIMPLAVDLKAMTPLVFGELALVIVAIITPVMIVASIAADRARRLFRSERAMRRVNRGAALTMAGVAAAVATR